MPADISYNFGGRTALVTGAASGIGRCTALAYAAAGASLVLADLSESGAAVCDEINHAGGKAVFRVNDVTDFAQCTALADLALSSFGRLDFAFNNAGILGRYGRLGSLTPADWRAVLDVNLNAVINCMHTQLQVMEATGGVIVNNASVMGLVGAPGAGPYAASKHGVVGLSKSVAAEYGRKGIRVNVVCPGFIRTPMSQSGNAASDKSVQSSADKTSLGRLGEPDEIAAAVLWLCSSGAAYVCGAAIAVDGGYTAV